MVLWPRWDLAIGGWSRAVLLADHCSAAKQNCVIRTANAFLSSKLLTGSSVLWCTALPVLWSLWLWQSHHCQQVGGWGELP